MESGRRAPAKINAEIYVGVRLAHVCFESDDLEATEAFYNILGINIRFEFKNQEDELVGYYLAFDNQTYIEVIKTGKLAGPGLGGVSGYLVARALS